LQTISIEVSNPISAASLTSLDSRYTKAATRGENSVQNSEPKVL